eukprot:TRINITY_DN111464_c0_g1_i1.p2 TRINITY_DN111464_c0_g1~~TRINITY_DN111464_c0_g1_i1.p2  ORF type:complete len:114 (+),score=25.72 TRINITY_DN111464_c0_g1_i1:105-446(+)
MQRLMLPLTRRSKDVVTAEMKACDPHLSVWLGTAPRVATNSVSTRTPSTPASDKQRRSRRVRFDLDGVVLIEVETDGCDPLPHADDGSETPKLDDSTDPLSYCTEIFERYPPP